MKKALLSLALFTFLISLNFLQAQTIYRVDDDATGANDGSSWESAFTDLQDALAAAEEDDEIWVAEGTYKPTGTFLIDKNLKLYGGFAGTESTLTERGDPADHPSVLSGDLNGDDVENDFETNREDNVTHIVNITGLAIGEVIFDGFTVRNGHADGSGSNEYGAGIYCLRAPKIRQCVFTQNYAQRKGGGVYVNAFLAEGTELDQCIFTKNRADETFDAGGGLYLGLVSGEPVTVNNCQFIENEGGRGSGLASYNSNLVVTNSIFNRNTNIRQGGGLWFWADGPNMALSVDNCSFQGNHSSFGGGLYAALGTNSSISVTNSSFESNEVSPNDLGWGQAGAGIFSYVSGNGTGASVSVDNCQFFGNQSSSDGSALNCYVLGKDFYGEVKNSEFAKNTAGDEDALGFWGTEGATGSVSVDSCLFENNSSFYAGALEMGNGWNGGASLDFTLKNSIFRNNTAVEDGAVLFWQSEASQTDIYVENCLFDGNEGTSRGGAIGLFPETANFNIVLNRCEIVNNQSPVAGAINSYNFFQSAFPTETSLLIKNSLIANNSSEDAAIVLDSVRNFSLLNCTVVDNQSAGIQLSDESTLTLQNSIIANPGFTEFHDLTGDVTVTSAGDNIIGDHSMDAMLASTDIAGVTPDFDDSYVPIDGGNLVNAGNNNGVLMDDLDLAGNPRIQNDFVDIGAYESGFTTSTREVIVGKIHLSPNPATDFIQLQLLETISTPNEISLFDPQGRWVEQQAYTKGQAVPVGHLPSGFYTLKLTDGEQVYIGRFVKQ